MRNKTYGLRSTTWYLRNLYEPPNWTTEHRPFGSPSRPAGWPPFRNSSRDFAGISRSLTDLRIRSSIRMSATVLGTLPLLTAASSSRAYSRHSSSVGACPPGWTEGAGAARVDKGDWLQPAANAAMRAHNAANR